MTTPASGIISIQNIKDEWLGGNALLNYYRGGSYVPTNYDNTAGIPASGTLGLTSFYNGTAEASGTDCLNHFWTNRAGYYRKSTGGTGSVWPGDSLATNGDQNNYVSSITTNCSYANSSLIGLSKWVTFIYVAVGAGASVNAYTGSTVNYSSDWGEISLRVVHFNTIARDLTAASMTWSRANAQAGSWGRVIVLPGKWGVASTVENPGINNGYTYTRSLPAGRCALFVGYLPSYNQNPLSPYSGTSVIQNSQWWYNACTTYFCVSPDTAQNMVWTAAYNIPANGKIPASTGYYATFTSNRRLFEFYRM